MEDVLNKIDKHAVERRFGASASSYDRYALAQQHIYRRLEQLLAERGRRQFDQVLEIGCGTGGFSKHIDERYQIDQWTLNDLGDTMLRHGDFRPRSGRAPHLRLGDAETLTFGERYDLILSASAIQWFHQPELFVRSLRTHLAPSGIVLMNTFGPHNLVEIRELTGRGLDYPSLSDVDSWLSDYPNHLVLEEVYPLSFASPREVLLHLKRTGVTAVGQAEGFWSVERLRAFEQSYIERFSQSDGSVRLSYHPIYMIAW